MFEAKVNKAIIFKELIQQMSFQAKDVNLTMSTKGITITHLSNDHSSISILRVDEADFDSIKAEGSITIGLNLESLDKLLTLAKKHDDITVKAEEGKQFIEINYENKGEERSDVVKVPTTDITDEVLTLPDVQYDGLIEMSSKEFSTMFRHMQEFSEKVRFEAKNQTVEMKFTGGKGAGAVRLRQGKVTEQTGVQVSFSQYYLAEFMISRLFALTKMSNLAPEVIISFSNDFPLKLEYKLGTNSGIISYLAAMTEEN